MPDLDEVLSLNHILYDFDDDLGDDAGVPLFLTPYITAGDVDTAKNLSRVGAIEGTDTISYSGYLTVNPTYNSNIFFWFFQALNNHETAPVLLWLQGGPGSSSMYALFVENGPFSVDKDYKLQPREYTWATNYNIIYIDNPVGTGWSFTDSDEGYVTDETGVANDLYSALTQFFILFPEYSANDFYVTGESYAGKYVPAIAFKIHTENPAAEVKINMKGISIGNGLTDPVTQNDYGDYLYGLGLIDGSQRDYYLEQQAEMVQLIESGDLVQAFMIFDSLLNGDFYPYGTYFYNCTGFNNYFNYLSSEGPNDTDYYNVFLEQASVRNAIHVGNLTFHGGIEVETKLIPDFMNSTKPWVEALLDNDYRVMLYNGQLDLIVPYAFTLAMINTFQWQHASDYQKAERIIWRVARADREVAGYVKPSFNFVEVMVRNAGHMVPYDQPRVAFDLITRFVDNKPWTN